MKKLLIAFDVDGTLRSNTIEDIFVPNERVCRMLIDLSHSKNVRIMVWSGGGELYARQAAQALGIASYVDVYADKQVVSCASLMHTPAPNHHHFNYGGPKPDIAFDDIQSFALGEKNIIVREK